MKKRMGLLLAAGVLLAGLLTLDGCRLAREDGAASGDRLIGVYVTTEYLDLLDMEAYLGDHMGQVLHGGSFTMTGDTSAYEERIYAVNDSDDPLAPNYTFPGLEGVAIYSVLAKDPEGGQDCWTSGEGDQAWMHVSYGVEDDQDSIEITADLYVSDRVSRHAMYANPMYQTADGTVYLRSGTGASGDLGEGATLSQTVEETTTLTENGETETVRCKVTVTMTAIPPAETIRVVQMSRDNEVLSFQDFPADQVPAAFTPELNTAYLLVESRSGDAVTRELYDREEESFRTYRGGETGFFSWSNTDICWPEA